MVHKKLFRGLGWWISNISSHLQYHCGALCWVCHSSIVSHALPISLFWSCRIISSMKSMWSLSRNSLSNRVMTLRRYGTNLSHSHMIVDIYIHLDSMLLAQFFLAFSYASSLSILYFCTSAFPCHTHFIYSTYNISSPTSINYASF